MEVFKDPFVVFALVTSIPLAIIYFWALFTGRLEDEPEDK